jgi:hypothetical protein
MKLVEKYRELTPSLKIYVWMSIITLLVGLATAIPDVCHKATFYTKLAAVVDKPDISSAKVTTYIWQSTLGFLIVSFMVIAITLGIIYRSRICRILVLIGAWLSTFQSSIFLICMVSAWINFRNIPTTDITAGLGSLWGLAIGLFSIWAFTTESSRRLFGITVNKA